MVNISANDGERAIWIPASVLLEAFRDADGQYTVMGKSLAMVLDIQGTPDEVARELYHSGKYIGRKINAIKEIRLRTGCRLKDAKDAADVYFLPDSVVRFNEERQQWDDDDDDGPCF